MSNNQNPAPVTGGRRTRVKFDGQDQGMLGTAWGDIKTFDRINQSSTARAVGVVEIPKVGYRLKPKQQDLSWQHELSTSQADILKLVADGGTLLSAVGIDSKYAFRTPDELTGVMTGTVTGMATQGDYFLYKKVPAGTDWSSLTLSADQAAFPGLTRTTAPDFQPSVIPQARLVMTNTPEDGTRPIMFRFVTSGAKRDNPDIICTFYFSGPASFIGGWQGQGQYAMVFKGDGQFDLWERCYSFVTSAVDKYEWRLMMKDHRYANKGQVANTHHRVMIFPYNAHSPKAGRGGGITFAVTAGDQANNNTRSVLELYKGSVDAQYISYDVRYEPISAFATTKTVPPTQPTPMRLDMRIDLRAEFQISYITYTETGFVLSSPFIYPSVFKETDTIYVEYLGQLPACCTLSAQLFDAQVLGQGDPGRTTNPGLTAVGGGSFANGGGGWASFNPWKNPTTNRVSNAYIVRITLQGVSATTPTLTQFRVLVNAAGGSPGTGEFEIEYPATVSEVNISGPDADPSHETGKVTINDLGSQYSLLNTRGEFVCRVTTEYAGVDWTDSANAGRESVLFDGYAVQSPAQRMGADMAVTPAASGLSAFPAPDWRQYQGTLLGKWKRIHEVVSTFNWDFNIDPNASILDTPPFAVDVIGGLLAWSGVDDTMIDIGPGKTFNSTVLPIRLNRGSHDEGIVLTAGANIADFIQGIARDYLGATLWWDANSTADPAWASDYSAVLGCWRLITPRIPPYNVLASFHTHPVAGGGHLAHMLGAYPNTTGTGDYSGQTIVNAPIYRESLSTYVSPPEVNKVIVTGSGELNTSRALVGDQLTVFAVNVTSFNFLGQSTANPNHPDFLGRERDGYKVDTSGITTPEAARWVCRRFYDLTAHAIKFVTFTAPLVLVQDVTDSAQKRPRPLKLYDAVYVDGQLYLVRNCNPFYNRDSVQLAHYELQSLPPQYATVG